MIMKVLWFTARSFSDLCSTTQQALIFGLLDNGFEVQLINGDQRPPTLQEGFYHVPLATTSRRGFQSSTLAKNMVAWLKKNPWFAQDVLPALRARVKEVLND